MQSNLSIDELNQEIAEADIEIRASSFDVLEIWLECKIEPKLWSQVQYQFEHKFWVVALLNHSCLYFNFVEGGWGWGKFSFDGIIEKYHWEQEELFQAFIWRYEDQLI